MRSRICRVEAERYAESVCGRIISMLVDLVSVWEIKLTFFITTEAASD
jgi:hypothetical protein